MSELRNPRNIAKMVNKYQNKKQIIESRACFGLTEEEFKKAVGKQDDDIVFSVYPNTNPVYVDDIPPWMNIISDNMNKDRIPLAKCANCGEKDEIIRPSHFDPKLHHCRHCLYYFKTIIAHNKR